MKNNFYDLLAKVPTEYTSDINEKLNQIDELNKKIEKLNKSIKEKDAFITELMDLCIKNTEERLKSFDKEIDKTNTDTPDIYIEEESMSVVCNTCRHELISNLKQSNCEILVCPKCGCGQVTVLKN